METREKFFTYPSLSQNVRSTSAGYIDTIFNGCSRLISFTATECVASLPWYFPPSNSLIEVAYLDILSRQFVEVTRTTVKTLYHHLLEHVNELDFSEANILIVEALMKQADLEKLDDGALEHVGMLVCAMVSSMVQSTLKVSRSLMPPRIRLTLPSDSVVESRLDTPTFSFDLWMARTMDSSLWR